MILDEILFSNISIIGRAIIKESGLTTYPQNITEMNIFLQTLKHSIDKNEFKGALIANILFSFVSSIEVRDRNTTSRNFEDIFSALFDCSCTDRQFRNNPPTTKEIQNLDYLCDGLTWKISTDLSGNKREKTDLVIDNYNISLKTLKGMAYSEIGSIIDSSINSELNIGSFSYRALLKGIIKDNELDRLSDRRSGLGSGSQLRKNVFNPILSNGKKDEFSNRLELFFRYVYEDDVFIVLKSNYRIDFILIPNKSFVDTIINYYRKNENEFERLLYRWENNNLRINWKVLLDAMDSMNYIYYRININLKNFLVNNKIDKMKRNINTTIKSFLEENI